MQMLGLQNMMQSPRKRAMAAVVSSAVAMLAVANVAHAANSDPSSTSYAISTNPSDWSVDRSASADPLENIGTWEGRNNVLEFGINPPASPDAFYNYQGYTQRTSVPEGNSFIGGDIFIESGWKTGTATDYERTGMWGSAMPAVTVVGGTYVDSKASFPIMSFTNQGGAGHLQVWDTTANPSTGWVDLPDTAGLINYGAWNSLDMQLLPGDGTSGKIQYYLNGTLVYTWSAPQGTDAGSLAQQFFAMYLEGYNNGSTSFASYWSDLVAGSLLASGSQITSTPQDVVVTPSDASAGVSTVAKGAAIGGSMEVEGSATTRALVAFSGDATIAKNLIARNTGVSFSTDSATTVKIGGDVELDTGSVTTGGNVVNPVQVGGSVSVDDSSVFGGNWSVGGNVTNAGKLNPGNSIGKIAVAGDLGLASTSEYDVQVNLAGQSDLVTVGGTATLAGAVSISPIDDYLIDHQYTILSAAGGFGGTTFDASKVVLENSQYLFIVPRLTYDANDVYLTIARNGKAFASIAQTANQDATANALDTLSSNNAAFAAVAKSTSAADAVNAFDQLSGESYASTKTALIQDSHYIRDAADERVRSSFSTAAAPSMPATTVDTNGKPVAASPNSSGVAVWTRGFGAWGHTDGEGGTSKLNDSTGGVLVGADSLIVNNWRVGGLFGYSHSNFDVDGRGSSAQSDNYHFGLYGGTQLGSVGIRIGAAYTTSSIDAGRSVNFANYADQTNSRYDVGTGQVFGEVGYQMNVGRVTVEPYANFAYVNLHSDAFQETGGDAALSSDGDTMNTAFSTLGLRGSADFGIGATDFTVRGSAGWQHAFGRVAPTTTVALSGSQSFSVSGVPLSRDVAVVDAGLNAAVGKNTSLGVAYLGQIGDGMQDHSFTANFNYKF